MGIFETHALESVKMAFFEELWRLVLKWPVRFPHASPNTHTHARSPGMRGKVLLRLCHRPGHWVHPLFLNTQFTRPTSQHYISLPSGSLQRSSMQWLSPCWLSGLYQSWGLMVKLQEFCELVTKYRYHQTIRYANLQLNTLYPNKGKVQKSSLFNVLNPFCY